MGIQESLEVLKRAQEIDREIYALRHELAMIPQVLHQLTETFEEEKSRMARLDSDFKAVQLRQKQKEGELGEKEALIRKYDSQLMQVKTNKEYSALKQEITSLKADSSLLEDSIIEILDEIDRVQKEILEERERLARVEKEWQEKKVELAKKEEELKCRLSGLNEKRKEAVAQVPPEARELYDKIIEKREGLALVAVEGEACGACRIEIRPQLLNDIKLKEVFVVCENCTRILYTD